MATLLQIDPGAYSLVTSNQDWPGGPFLQYSGQTFTVPAGKIWTLSGYQMYVSAIPTAETWSCKLALCGAQSGVPDLTNILSESVRTQDMNEGAGAYWAGVSLRVLTAGVYAVALWDLQPGSAFPDFDPLTVSSGGGSGYTGGAAYQWQTETGKWTVQTGNDAAIIITGVESDAPFAPPVGGPTKRRLVACANNKLWYEDV